MHLRWIWLICRCKSIEIPFFYFVFCYFKIFKAMQWDKIVLLMCLSQKTGWEFRFYNWIAFHFETIWLKFVFWTVVADLKDLLNFLLVRTKNTPCFRLKRRSGPLPKSCICTLKWKKSFLCWIEVRRWNNRRNGRFFVLSVLRADPSLLFGMHW